VNPDSIRRLRLQAAAAFAVLLIMLWAVIGYQVKHVKDDALEAAREQGANLAGVIAAHFTVFATDIDLRLRRCRARWVQDPNHFAGAIALERALAPDPSVLQIAVIDREGRLAFSDPAQAGGREPSGSGDYFRIHKEGGSDRLFISAPGAGGDRATGTDSIRFSRPIRNGDGEFLGVIVLLISAQELLRVHGDIELGRDAIVTIRRSDGIVLVRSASGRHSAPAPARPIPDPPELSAGSDAGSFVRRSPLDGIERLHSFRRLTEPGVTVIAAQSLDAALAGYRAQRNAYLTGGALISAALAALLALANATLRRAERADRQLRQSEARMRSLIDLSSDFYWETDARHRLTVLTMGPRHRSVVPLDDWRGKTRWERPYLAPDEEGWRRHRETLDAHQAFRDFEFSRRASDGMVRDLLISGEPVFDAVGRFFGYRGIGHDITVLRRAQEELRQTEQQRALLEAVPEAAWLKDREGRYLAANAAFRADAGSMAGKTDRDLFDAETAARRAAEDGAVIGCGERRRSEERYSIGGREHWAETIRVPIRNAAGEITGIAATSRDITERKMAEAERSVRDAVQRQALVKEVHHRIKNNLQGVISMVQRLALEHPESAALLETVIARVNAVAAMHGLYGSIGGREFRLDQIVSNLVAALRTNHEDLPLSLAIRSGASDLQVVADEVVPLALIINELIWNAVKHSRADARGEPVEIAVEGAGERVCIRIRNRTGRLPAQFDFEDRVGLGTGLALVKSLLPPQGAALRFENLASDGVQVELRLQPPVVAAGAAVA